MIVTFSMALSIRFMLSITPVPSWCSDSRLVINFVRLCKLYTNLSDGSSDAGPYDFRSGAFLESSS
jgi:hypothetical protein